MYEITMPAAAKINLTLNVLGKRPDGYHEVEMIMQSISLRDYLVFRYAEAGVGLSCSSPDLPMDENNLVTRAVHLLKQHYPWDGGVIIHLEKKIPMAAGLGGGSSNAAATLKGLNQLFKLGLNLEDLVNIGAKLGSDVPFCLLEGTAIAKGRGELLTPVPGTKQLWMVLVKPNLAVSTAKVYQEYRDDQVAIRPQTTIMTEALLRGDLNHICANLVNVLETVTIDWYPEIDQIKHELLAAGASGALMSGSGPTVFGLAENQERAEMIAEQFRPRYKEVFVASTL